MSEVESELTRKRSNVEISAEILRVARRGAIKSHIVYKTNLNFKLVNKYLNCLKDSGLITGSPDMNKVFSTTEKGLEYLNNFGLFEDFIKRLNLA